MEAGKQLLDQFWASDLCQNDLIGIGQRLDRKCGFGLALPLSEAVSSLHQIQKYGYPGWDVPDHSRY